MKQMVKIIIAFAVMLMVASACSEHICPAYSDAQQPATEQANG